MADQTKIDKLYEGLRTFNQKRGYFLNPDTEFTKALVSSLVTNEERYGYQACPCRLATGVRAEDLDIICPCDYRDSDITQYGACYCGLYVSQNISLGKQELKPIPERRPTKEMRTKMAEVKQEIENKDGKLPVWRCTVCGYLCAREDAPEICPICGVAHDRFERFM